MSHLPDCLTFDAFDLPPAFVARCEAAAVGSSDTERAVGLYFFVRDAVRYNPFVIEFDDWPMRPHRVWERKQGHCVDKAMLYVLAARRLGMESRLGLARVRNHAGTARLEQMLGTDVLVPHGYAAVFLDQKWIKCTPAFNRELCIKLNVEPLDWDGRSDSLLQESDKQNRTYMEYLEDYGLFDHVPVSFMLQKMADEYPGFRLF